MADPTLSERLVDFFAVHQAATKGLDVRFDDVVDLLIDIKSRAQSADIALMKRITDMDANVAALTVAVTSLTTKVDAALAQVGKLSAADEASLAAAVTDVNALGAKVDAVVTPPAAPAA